MAVLGTKIHVPAPRRDLVQRPRLLERLGTAERPRLILVSAPAGFGKTTVLSQWVADTASADDRVAWLSLDQADNRPRRFLEHLVAALQTIVALPDAAELVATGAEVPPEVVLTFVVNELDLQPGRIVLALDDYHVIEAPEVHRVVTFLLDHLPPQARLAVATRADPPFPLSRLRARGELVELRASDLRFTPEEAGAFLDVMGLDLSQSQVAALDARTEGWVAGLQLAGLSLRGVDDADGFVEAFTGSHRFVLDYLVEEVLRHQPEPVRSFLLQTAVLRQLTGPLCDALIGGRDGAAVLEMLERDNLFLVPLDDQRQWYRYHHLFADALRARLAAELPGRASVLHRAASEWYAAHGLAEDAVRHALDAGDAEHAADLVEAALPDLRRERRDRLVREWLTALPVEVVQGRPLLGTYLAWTRLVVGDLDGVEVAPTGAERALEANPPSARAGATAATVEELRTLPATIAIFRASAAQARDDPDATQQHARHALSLTEPGDHMARGGALGFLGLAAWGRGDLVEAVAIFSQAVQDMGAAGDVADELGSAVPLASMWMGRGHPAEARRLYERALATAHERRGAALATLGDLHAGVADVLVEQGELDAAEEHLQSARALGEPASLLENGHRWYVAMSRLKRALGDLEAAAELLVRAQALYLPGFFPDVRPVQAQLARTRIAQGRLAEAWEWARDHEPRQPDQPSYLEEFDQLTHVRLLLAQHRADGDASHLADAADRLGRLVTGAEAGGRGGSLVEIRMLRALVHQARDERAAAASELGALLEALPAGYVRIFLDEGEPMDELLRAVERLPRAGDLARRLRHAAYRQLPVPTAGEAEGLSEREVEVLRLLATSLSGPEIARELFVSLNTLRTHTKHIFTKLDVNTRRAAVTRADERGLL
jgi:LuxR family transcriptional regulator, maltose regulon positive regulatory protein